jgi:hypothetical protein
VPPSHQPGRMNPPSATTEAVDRETPPPAVLRGLRLWVARLVCTALVALAVGLFVASVPISYSEMRTPCEEGTECSSLYFLSPEDMQVLKGWGLSATFFAAYNVVWGIVFAAGCLAIGATLFWKKSDDWLALLASIVFVTFGVQGTGFLLDLAYVHPGWDLPVDVVNFVANVSWFVLLCVFPDGRFVPRWTRWAAAAWVAQSLASTVFYDTPFGSKNWPMLIDLLVYVGLVGSVVLAQVYRYRRVSEPVTRQQTKWFVFGFAVFFVVAIGYNLIGWTLNAWFATSGNLLLYVLVGDPLYYCAAFLIPLAISVAILRYRLWDLAIIVARTLLYGSLTAVLATVFAIANELLLPSLMRTILGEENSTVNVVVSTVIIAVMFEPLRSSIKVGVDRLTQTS